MAYRDQEFAVKEAIPGVIGVIFGVFPEENWPLITRNDVLATL